MAAKKFTIPSLSEMEKNKTEEYKVKTLFDRHKNNQISPKKTVSENGENKNANGPDVSKTTGPKGTSNIVGSSFKKTSSSFTTKPGQEKQAGAQLSSKSSSNVIIAKVDSQKVGPQKVGRTPQQSKSASGGLSTGSHVTTGISPNRASKTASLIVSARQRGNPLLKHVRSVPWEFSDIVADYEMGTVMCALFLSLRYHNLNPNYIHERLKLLGHSYDLRVLLVQVDTKDPHHSLRELAKICVLADCTLVCAWTPEEAARYLETYKVFEKKPPDMIMEKQEVDYVSRAQDVLTSGRKVNRTDVLTLLSTFGSFENLVHAGEEEMSFCPGLGVHKAKRLHSLLHEPFLKAKKRKKIDE